MSVFSLDPNNKTILFIKVSSLKDKMETILSTCLIIDIWELNEINKKNKNSEFLACSQCPKNIGLFMFQTAKNT